MTTPPTTLLERLIEDGFPIAKLYKGHRPGFAPLAELILKSPLIFARSQAEWTYKSLADFGEEQFILNASCRWDKGCVWEEYEVEWWNSIVKDLAFNTGYLGLYEEHEGLTLHVRDGDQFRLAKTGDVAYDHMCQLRESYESLTDQRFVSAPSWAKELHIFRPNFLAHKMFWYDTSSVAQEQYVQMAQARARGVTQETARLVNGGNPTDEEQGAAWDGGFDEKHPKYPPELDIAMQAWLAVRNVESALPPRKQLEDWLMKSYPALKANAVDRIIGVCNWDKTGGRPKS